MRQTQTLIGIESTPGSWLPEGVLDGAPLQRIRLPDRKSRTRTQIYYDGLLEICQSQTGCPTVAQLITNMRPEALPWLRRLKGAGIATAYSVSQFPTWQQKPAKRIFRRRGYRRVYNAFDTLVTNSEAIEEFLRSIGVTTRIEYIPNGVNLQRFHPIQSDQEQRAREALRRRFGIPRGSQCRRYGRCGYAAQGTGNRSSCMARSYCTSSPILTCYLSVPVVTLHDPKLTYIQPARLHILSRHSGATDQVHFTGIVDDVEDYLRAADISLLASNREGTPNSVLEAMATRTTLPSHLRILVFLQESAKLGEHYQLVERNHEAIALALT